MLHLTYLVTTSNSFTPIFFQRIALFQTKNEKYVERVMYLTLLEYKISVQRTQNFNFRTICNTRNLYIFMKFENRFFFC